MPSLSLTVASTAKSIRPEAGSCSITVCGYVLTLDPTEVNDEADKEQVSCGPGDCLAAAYQYFVPLARVSDVFIEPALRDLKCRHDLQMYGGSQKPLSRSNAIVTEASMRRFTRMVGPWS